MPDPSYAGILKLLNYPSLLINEQDGICRLAFDLKQYLQNHASFGVIKFTQDDPNASPLLLLNSYAMEAKKVYYATKELDDGRVEVTPYFFVPDAIIPPDYHFVLDVSGSMRADLSDLKQGVKTLAQQLFILQPNAQLIITTFSSEIKKLGVYGADQLEQLNSAVDSLIVESDTHLYEVTADFLDLIKASNSKQCNVLLFTDGEDNGSKYDSESRIKVLIDDLKASSVVREISNFNFVSYKVKPNNLMQEVVETFTSGEFFETTSANFVAAPRDPELLMRWAAARGIFSIRFVVKSKLGDQVIAEYKEIFPQSSQLAALKPRICLPGETLEVSVSDINSNELLQSSIELAAKIPVQEAKELSMLEDQVKEEVIQHCMHLISQARAGNAESRDFHGEVSSTLIPRFFLDCLDRCLLLATNYCASVVRECPSYFNQSVPSRKGFLTFRFLIEQMCMVVL